MNPSLEILLQAIAVVGLTPLVIGLANMVEAKFAQRAIVSPLASYRQFWKALQQQQALTGSWVTRHALGLAGVAAVGVAACLPLAASGVAIVIDLLGVVAVVVVMDAAVATAAFDEDERSAKRREWSLGQAIFRNLPLMIAAVVLVAINGSSELLSFVDADASRDVRVVGLPAAVLLLSALIRVVPIKPFGGAEAGHDTPFAGRPNAVVQLVRLTVALALAIFSVRLLVALPFVDEAASLWQPALVIIGSAVGLGLLAGAFHAVLRKVRLSLVDVTIVAIGLAVAGFVVAGITLL